jgi:hypothetical protein
MLASELRVARGTKFDYVLDSYIYAAILLDAYDDAVISASGSAYLLTGDLRELILAAARYWRVTEHDLQFTPEEIQYLTKHRGVVVLESEGGRCDTYWMQNETAAYDMFKGYQMSRFIQLAPEASFRDMNRLSPMEDL